MTDLTQPFRVPLAEHRELAKQATEWTELGEATCRETPDWPSIRQTIAGQHLPLLRGLAVALRAARRPIRLGQLSRAGWALRLYGLAARVDRRPRQAQLGVAGLWLRVQYGEVVAAVRHGYRQTVVTVRAVRAAIERAIESLR